MDGISTRNTARSLSRRRSHKKRPFASNQRTALDQRARAPGHPTNNTYQRSLRRRVTTTPASAIAHQGQGSRFRDAVRHVVANDQVVHLEGDARGWSRRKNWLLVARSTLVLLRQYCFKNRPYRTIIVGPRASTHAPSRHFRYLLAKCAAAMTQLLEFADNSRWSTLVGQCLKPGPDSPEVPNISGSSRSNCYRQPWQPIASRKFS